MSDDTTERAPLPVPAPPQHQPATVKQLHFARYYLETGNGIESARRAGYKGSDGALRNIADGLLERDDVGLYIGKHLEALMSPEEAGSILSDIARGDIGHFLAIDPEAPQGIRIDLSSPEAQSHRHLIRSIKTTRFGVEIQLYDKLTALALIARYTQLENPTSMRRRAVESLISRLSPEERVQVREDLMREWSTDVIEGETPAVVDLTDDDLSFLEDSFPAAQEMQEAQEAAAMATVTVHEGTVVNEGTIDEEPGDE